jgi:ElaB/YqjD/DUF883 family membrane-anchored ribosome-binding protein
MEKYECPQCGKEYGRAPSGAKYCSRKCAFPNQERMKEYLDNFEEMFAYGASQSTKSAVRCKVKKALKNLPFDPKKYEKMIVDYEGSPGGKAYVGHAKEPFMKTDTGIGFKGVILQDETRQFVQCYECGKWMSRITNGHLQKCSNLTSTEEYKEKHELNFSMGLVSDNLSIRYAENAMKNKAHVKNNYKALHENRKKAIKKSQEKARNKKDHSIAYQNKHATCPLQILNRLRNFVYTNQELPGPRNRGRALYKVIRKRFGSFGHGLQSMGFPYFQRRGTNYHYSFPDGDILEFNINKNDQRFMLFQAIMDKCPVMTDPDIEKYLPQKT